MAEGDSRGTFIGPGSRRGRNARTVRRWGICFICFTM
ncbi:hypothetical protein XaavBphi31_01 [Xanthomonas phage Xaa_vB_phi31]|uniref:Uncharacterized protein n=1 Tax=Xanthomonas phage Xaa_vB_phi31 TaxID=2776752 RepID=A0A868BYY9_9CAUD|nr:hypothetical protein XaavBphi31_01 [Xanthomonas phage Xaa_vB_phi31]